jgi:hypothetical protein
MAEFVTKAYKLKTFVSERKVLILNRLHSKESTYESSGLEMTVLLFKSEIPLHLTGWARSHHTPRQYAPQTQIKFTQHSTAQHSTQYNVK